ncbi:OmpA family protein [Treponema sp. R6D11]
MKNKTILSIFNLIVFVAICFTACDMGNPIMEKWWEEKEPEPKDGEPEYIALIKDVPIISYQTIYDTIIDKEIQYETIFVNLPPETIIEYVYEQLPPEIIYQTITVPEYITVYQDVIKYIDVPTPPTKEDIINWLKDPANKGDVEKIINIIKDEIPVDVIKEIIKNIPPQDIIEYLTDEQIKYIIEQQPPSMILQSIRIIGIEYVIFAGDSSTVNGDHGSAANTNLTDQEKAYNTSTIKEMAQLMKDNPTYIIMLHGHANPVTFTDEEKVELTTLSNDRAEDVERVFIAEYNALDKQPATYDNPNLKGRISCSGYGGEKTLFANNTSYSALNRRVEMILFEIVTTTVAPNIGN